MIDLSNISVTFSENTPLERRALNSVNLSIAPEEFITIIGNNGAGKSTLMGILAGSIPVDSGTILIDNDDVTKKSVCQRAGQIARVFQDPRAGTCENLTIAENMSLAYDRGNSRNLSFALDKKRKQFFQNRITELGVELEDRINDPVGSLSGGQRQALSLLMATLSPAKLLLLDEHTAALDPKMAEIIMELTNRLYYQYNLTILMITHNIKHALEYGTRTIMLQNGEIAHDFQGDERKGLDPTSLY
jgi:putative tryptophan/tyrosine transport system ATP-binding protein